MATRKLTQGKRNFNKDLHRTIRTTYYFGKDIVKHNTAMHANRAVLHCVNHMQMNTYDATHAEVYDEADGTLHCVITRAKGARTITILYKRPVRESY